MPEENPSAPEASYQYDAFISYCRDDNREEGRCWANWIQRTVQRFVIPERLVGNRTVRGAVPARMGDVFLDATDLPPGGELEKSLAGALRKSRFLILIGSPRSAKSEYVGLEIEEFVKCRGWESVIPMVIEGTDAPCGDPACWVHPKYLAALPGGKLPPYVEFRVKEKQRGENVFLDQGWVDPIFYEKDLAKKAFYGAEEQRRNFLAYHREHRTATFHLLAALTGLLPRDLSEEAAIEESERQREEALRQQEEARRQQEEARRQRSKKRKARAVVLLFALLAAVTFGFYREAERQRAHAVRSLQMIGDAHEGASRTLSDVLVDLRAKLQGTGSEKLAEDAERTVNEFFDESVLAGGDDESIHMRSVVLNSRGYLARRTGDFDAAEKHYEDALRLRRGLSGKNPSNLMYEHNIAVSLDNEGDLFIARAMAEKEAGRDGGDHLSRALGRYRESLRIAKKLADGAGATKLWRHDYAVSCFKVGDTLLQVGDLEHSLAALNEGLPVAKSLAAEDPEYAKFQAHVALFQLDIGKIEATQGHDDVARAALNSAMGIFAGLEKRGRLTRLYAKWRADVEAVLADIAPGK